MFECNHRFTFLPKRQSAKRKPFCPQRTERYCAPFRLLSLKAGRFV
ncbi:hypothetical protein GBL_0956 [Geobacillus kaustophilus GBlys]|uniref:Uncharacterized protein n=1 Tax=Geobacillus kaustophilus GBlys TaxID=1337888 RepID=U2Y156_GEOKU|nr:hypothetical protein GBL_0956 [Geobacillus kaustophilus GBlys]